MIVEYYEGLSRAQKRAIVLQIAEGCHLHPNTASMYVRGKKKPGPLAAEKIAEIIGKPVKELFEIELL